MRSLYPYSDNPSIDNEREAQSFKKATEGAGCVLEYGLKSRLRPLTATLIGKFSLAPIKIMYF